MTTQIIEEQLVIIYFLHCFGSKMFTQVKSTYICIRNMAMDLAKYIFPDSSQPG